MNALKSFPMMASLCAAFRDLSPFVAIGSVLACFVVIWLLSYASNWLQDLESGVRVSRASVCFEDPTSLKKVPCPSIFDCSEKYLSIVIPAYNEEARLPVALDEALLYLQWRTNKDKTFTYEIIIVDDGSTDNTVKVAFDYVKKYSLDHIRVIKQGRNSGKGAAVRTGILCARGELLLMLDADGATKVIDMEKLENQIKVVAEQQAVNRGSNDSKPIPKLGDSCIVAFGSRAHLEKQAFSTRKWYRNILMKGFHFCVLMVVGPGVRDTQCGFKMFTRAAAQQLFINMRLKRWCFDVELVHLCKRLRIPFKEVTVNWTEIPGSKLRLGSILHMLVELVLIRLGYGFRIWQIHRGFVQG